MLFQVLSSDGLPQNICGLCKIKLVNSCEFKSKCLKADSVLKSLLKGEFVAKDETSEVEIKVKNESHIHNNNVQDFKEETAYLAEGKSC